MTTTKPSMAAKEPQKRKQSLSSKTEPQVVKRRRTSETKASTPKASQDGYDISGTLPRTKPGVSGKVPRNKLVSHDGILPTSETSIDIAILKQANLECQPGHDTPSTSASQSQRGALARSYQNAFATQTTLKSDGNVQSPDRSSSTMLGGPFEATMNNLIDDDVFFQRLETRPQKSEDLCRGPSPLREYHPRSDGQEVVAQDRDSFFDEALEDLAFEEVDVSQLSPSLIDPAHGSGQDEPAIRRSDHTANSGPTSKEAEVRSVSGHPPQSSGVEAVSSNSNLLEANTFRTMDDDEYSLSDQDDCFAVYPNEEKQRALDKPDLLIAEDIDTLPEDPFADEDLDAELLNFSTAAPVASDGQSPPFTQRTPPASNFQWTPPTPYTPIKPSPLNGTGHKKSRTTTIAPRIPLSNKTPKTAPHQIATSPTGQPIPFIRPTFPTPLLQRSPIPGLSPATVLRTCFRIGEALNAASLVLRAFSSTDAVIELYCRVKHSGREANGYKQYFEFTDLFKPDNPPFLNGTYAIWKGVDLWDHDSKAFLGDKGKGKIARVVGRIKRGEKGKGWEMNVLSIWEATWEDVGVVKGVVCS